MKEIHHRTKNNLAVVQSLLSLQSRYISDEESKSVFRESENRIKSMSMIHEKLYKAEDLKNINLREYIHSLVTQLFQSYNISDSRIMLNIEVPDVMFDVDTIKKGSKRGQVCR